VAGVAAPQSHPYSRPMKHFLLFYEAGPDYLERRPAFRGEHLQRAWDAANPVRPEDL